MNLNEIKYTPLSLEEKLKRLIYSDETYGVIEFPHDVNFLYTEGVDMNHCLSFKETAREYTQRLINGEQRQFSFISLETGEPIFDIELSISKSSYSGSVNFETVTQIRGNSNKCPPDPQYLLSLLKFFESNKSWVVWGHGVKNFDGGVDGDKFLSALKCYYSTNNFIPDRFVRVKDVNMGDIIINFEYNIPVVGYVKNINVNNGDENWSGIDLYILNSPDHNAEDKIIHLGHHNDYPYYGPKLHTITKK